MPQPRVPARAGQQSRGGKLQRPFRPLTKADRCRKELLEGKARLRREREEDARSVSRGPTPEFSLLDVHPAFREDPRLQAWIGDSVPPESPHTRPSSASERRKRHVAVCAELQQQPRVLQVRENVWQDASLSYVLDAKKRTAELRQKTMERLTKDIEALRAEEEAERSSAPVAVQDDSRPSSRAKSTKDDSRPSSRAKSTKDASRPAKDTPETGLLCDIAGLLVSRTSGGAAANAEVSDSSEDEEAAEVASSRESKETSGLEKTNDGDQSKDSGRSSGSLRRRLSRDRKASKEAAMAKTKAQQEEGATVTSTEQPSVGSGRPSVRTVPSPPPFIGAGCPELLPGRKAGRASMILQEVRAEKVQKFAALEVVEEQIKPTSKKTSFFCAAGSSPLSASVAKARTDPSRSPSPKEGRPSVITPEPRKSIRPPATHRVSAAIVSLDPFQSRRRSAKPGGSVFDAALDSQRTVLEEKRKLRGLTAEADVKITRDILQGTSVIRVVLSPLEKEFPGAVLERGFAAHELAKLPVFRKEPDRDASYVWLVTQLAISRNTGLKSQPPKLLIKGVDKELQTYHASFSSEPEKTKEDGKQEDFEELANIFQNFQGKLKRSSIDEVASFFSHDPDDEMSREEKARDNLVKQVAQNSDIPLDTAEALMTWFRALNTSGNGMLTEDEFRVCVRAIYNSIKRTLTGGEANLKRLWNDANAKTKDLRFEHWVIWLVEEFPQVCDMYPSQIRVLKAISAAA